MAEDCVYPAEKLILLSLKQKNNIQEMKISEGWRGFGFPPAGYKLDNEGKPVVEQSFFHNLNSQIIQVSASGNSLVPMPPPPSGPPPILPFVIKDASTSVQSFGRKGNRQQISDNIISFVSINGRPYNGTVFDDKINRLT